MNFERMLAYCAGLEANNQRTWFHENHKWYEQARSDFHELLEIIRFSVGDAAPELWDGIMHSNVKDWCYRIARDMRYSQGKPPYNPAFRAYISADKKSNLPIGYFLRVAPGRSCFGTGLYVEKTAEMNQVRDYISANWQQFQETLLTSGFTLSGSSLKTMPRGYDRNHPAADLLKMKNWMLNCDIPDAELGDFESFDQYIRDLTRRMEPVRQLLYRAATVKPSQRQIYEDFYQVEDFR